MSLILKFSVLFNSPSGISSCPCVDCVVLRETRREVGAGGEPMLSKAEVFAAQLMVLLLVVPLLLLLPACQYTAAVATILLQLVLKLPLLLIRMQLFCPYCTCSITAACICCMYLLVVSPPSLLQLLLLLLLLLLQGQQGISYSILVLENVAPGVRAA